MNRFTLAGITTAFVLALGGVLVFEDPLAFGASTPKCTITGTPSNDVLTGTTKADVICGLGGNDTISGGTGNDTILGGTGDDLISGGTGNDKLDGGSGIDTVTFVNSASAITASLKTGKATGAGSDTLTADENITGGRGNDAIAGDGKPNVLAGGPGNDRLNGGQGLDTVDYSSAGGSVDIDLSSDTATGQGTDTLIDDENATGGLGDDNITGDDSANVISGGYGDDYIEADGGADTVEGGPGDDGIIGGAGADDLNGDSGSNLCDRDAKDKAVAYCGFDSSAPVVKSIELSSTSVDTSTGPVTVKVTMRVTDDLVGVQRIAPGLQYGFPSLYSYGTGSMVRTSGTGLDGTYEASILIPAGAPRGKLLFSWNVFDAVGNFGSRIAPADGSPILDSDGGIVGPGSVEQVGVGDSEEPKVRSIELSRTSVDTSSGAATVNVRMRITDNMTGVRGPTVGMQYGALSYSSRDLQRTSGNDTDGIYTGTILLPAGAPQGKYIIGYLVSDSVGNFSRKLAPADGSALLDSDGGIVGPGSVEQIGLGDSDGPTVRSIEFSRTSIDTSSGAVTIKVKMHVTDNLSGVDSTGTTLNHGAVYSTVGMTLTAGTALDGTYEGTITIPTGAPKGTYTVNFGARDGVGNSTWKHASPDGSPLLDAEGNLISLGSIQNG